MKTYTANQMKESYDDGFREGIIQGRNRQRKESNAAMRDHWKLGYDTALQDAINAVNKFINNPEDDWDKAIDNLFIKKIIEAIKSPCYHTKYEGCPPCIHDNAIFRAQSTELFEGSE